MFDQMKLAAWTSGIRDKYDLPLRVELWNGEQVDLSSEQPRVKIRVPNMGALRYLLTPTLDSLGEAYVEGQLEIEGRSADMIHIGSLLAESTGKPPRSSRVASAAMNLFAAHTKEKDAESIRYHYDVSNEFYQQFLDPAMVYSCAYFENGDEDLATAQQKKIDHILTKIGVQPGHTLLDIGCGWGALAIRAASKFGARVVGVTLSERQYEMARERVAQAALQDRIEIRLQDYRDVSGTFDRITSVGMFEHVGVDNLPEYFNRIDKLLADDGLVMNHGITTTDIEQRASPYGGGEFIDKYVFPHGELGHLSTVIRTMQQGGLEVRDVENLRRHYARTCELWAENFEDNAERIRPTVDPKTFRIWHVYLAGCAYAFAHDWISLYQIVCGKAGQDPKQIPWSRNYMYK
ncbi:cyclopropane-fatty-acyl-phospholipid synthase family protein [Massilia sp. 9096]|uniref:SAM-dependent methyltransferase n=1 Tax=Massilia sp. 9096 TaxID=1500894 RepID=UPI0005626733|nr:cyclopropane-fatty-acyl-phospholipid synthase family protein [Massilia sp. 9096]